MLKEFRAFILRGNVVDLAVGIIIGVAFTSVVNSAVNDLIMPPIGFLMGNVDFSSLFTVIKEGATPGPYMTPAQAKVAGAVTINWGQFINTIISLLIVGFVTFLLVRGLNKLYAKEQAKSAPERTTKECPYCLSAIPANARRCAQCTSQLSPA